MPVQVAQEELEPCRVALTIDVPAEESRKAVDSVFARIAKRTTVPGFRPGKAPPNLVRRYVNQDQVREMAVEEAVRGAFRDALRQTGLQPYEHGEPQLELPDDFDLAEGFRFQATVPLEPVVELGSLDDLTARRVVVAISEQDVDRELDRVREQLAEYVETAEPAADGDRVAARLELEIDGVPAPEHTGEEPTLFEVGVNLDEFDAQLRGITAGESRRIEFRYPGDDPDPARAGKPAVASIAAHQILRRQVPEVDDRLAQTLECDDVAALRNRVRIALQAHANRMADEEVARDLIQEAVDRSRVSFPEEMLARETSGSFQRLIQALSARSITLEQYLAGRKIDLADLQSELRLQARKSLEESLVLLEIGRTHGVSVSEREFEAELRVRAEAENVSVAQLRRVLTDTNQLGSLRAVLARRKLAAFLRERAQVEEVQA